MTTFKRTCLSVGIFFLFSGPVFAGGAMVQNRKKAQEQLILQRRLQMEKIRRAAEQKAAQHLIADQKKAIQEAAIQKALIQRQVAVTQYQVARETAIAQQRALQQAAIMQVKTMQQATLAQQKAVQQVLLEQAMQKKMAAHAVAAGIQQAPRAETAEVKDVVTLDQLLFSLEESSRAWEMMIDEEAKEAVVASYIQKYREQGVTIRKPPGHYVALIDGMARESPEMLANPFSRIMELTAIVEYDFDNGMNKDAMARQVLGEEGFRQNRKRLGAP